MIYSLIVIDCGSGKCHSIEPGSECSLEPITSGPKISPGLLWLCEYKPSTLTTLWFERDPVISKYTARGTTSSPPPALTHRNIAHHRTLICFLLILMEWNGMEWASMVKFIIPGLLNVLNYTGAMSSWCRPNQYINQVGITFLWNKCLDCPSSLRSNTS